MNTTHVSRLTFKLSCLNFLDYFNQGQPTCPGSATESEHCRTCNMQSVPSGHGESRMNFRQWLQQGQDFSAVKFSAAQPLLFTSFSFMQRRPSITTNHGNPDFFSSLYKPEGRKAKKWYMQCAPFPWLPCLVGGVGKHKQSPQESL